MLEINPVDFYSVCKSEKIDFAMGHLYTVFCDEPVDAAEICRTHGFLPSLCTEILFIFESHLDYERVYEILLVDLLGNPFELSVARDVQYGGGCMHIAEGDTTITN